MKARYKVVVDFLDIQIPVKQIVREWNLKSCWPYLKKLTQ